MLYILALFLLENTNQMIYFYVSLRVETKRIDADLRGAAQGWFMGSRCSDSD